MIQFRNISKSFGTKHVLDNVSLEVGKGEIVFVLGKSGTGKSVLLKHVVGLLRPDSGEIWIDGQRVDTLDEKGWLPVRRRCGMVFQFPALLDFLTIRENMGFGLGESLGGEKVLRRHEEQFVEYLRRVHLPAEVLNNYPTELSFGTQKRCAVARALVAKPDALLFDEPTTGLDPVSTHAVDNLISELNRDLKLTALVVSHDIESAMKIADRVILLDAGTVVANASPESLLQSPHALVRAFLEGVRHASASSA